LFLVSFGWASLFFSAGCATAFGAKARHQTVNAVPRSQILTLAVTHFKRGMSTAEKNLLDATSVGEEIDCTAFPEPDRAIDSKLLVWLCTSPEATKLVTYRGIAIIGAEIPGTVDLAFANVTFPLRAARCHFRSSIDLRSSHLAALDLSGSQVNLTDQSPPVDQRAFQAQGQSNPGLDLSGATIDGNLVCDGCHLVGHRDASAIRGIGAHIKGFVYLRKDKKTGTDFNADGGVDFTSATIDNNVECDGGYFFDNGEVTAFKMENADVSGSMFLRDGFCAAGKVFLRNIKIRGDLDCSGGAFQRSGDDFTIDAEGAKIDGCVYLRKNPGNADFFSTNGTVDFSNATIEKNLQCDGGNFSAAIRRAPPYENQPALILEYADIKGSVCFCDSFVAEGTVDLQLTKISGDLDCHGGKFLSHGLVDAIDGRNSRISGSIWLTRTADSNDVFKSEGMVDFSYATVEGIVDCNGGKFSGKDGGLAFNGDGINVTGDMYLNDGFIARGGVSLVRAKLHSDLNCNNGHFFGSSPRNALIIKGAQIGGSVNLRKDFPQDGFTAEGGVTLARATIGGDLDCSGGQFIGCGANTDIDASASKIGGNVYLRNAMQVERNVLLSSADIGGDLELLVQSPRGRTITLDLQSAKVGRLVNDPKFFSRQDVLLDGFVFDLLGESKYAKNQLAWLKLQPEAKFSPQPYEQMAEVLRKMGFQDEAVQLLIEKNQRVARDAVPANWGAMLKELHKNRYHKAILDLLAWVTSCVWFVLFALINFGYGPGLAFIWSLLLIAFGWRVFHNADSKNEILAKPNGANPVVPSVPKNFNALFYSLETFVPLVNLGIAENFTPKPGRYRGYLWFHIISGWALTTLWVVGFTGVLKT
jgi:hypothetical protein